MSAMRGAEFDTVMSAEAPSTPPMVMPTPISAVSSGSPAASSDQNVTNSTTPAKTTPSPSTHEIGTLVAWNTWPPNSTVRPSARAASAVATSSASPAGSTPEPCGSNCTWV